MIAAPPEPMPTAESGLSTAVARERLARYGPNAVEATSAVPVWRRVLAQLADPLVVVLLGAMVLTLATGDLTDTVIIAFVVVVNTAVGVAQELRADHAIAALSQLAAPTAQVRRDGAQVTVSAAEVVPGDVVVLAEGDVVPADGRLIEAVRLLVDESALTGEAEPVEKAADPAPDDLAAGTVVVRGRGVMWVTATGAESALGRIAALVSRQPQQTPLQRRLAGLGRLLAAAAGVMSLVVFALGLARGVGVELMAVTAVSLVVAAVPESLPAVVTLALALGARRMARANAIVRRLPAVETLGSVTVVATDKTGTLTQGRMAAEWLWTAADGQVHPGAAPSAAESELLRATVLCNDARLAPVEESTEEWVSAGDPTETALLRVAAAAGWHREALDKRFPRVAEIPFESIRRRMTTVHRAEPDFLVVMKGAPEVVLTADTLVDDERTMSLAAAQARAFASDGYRVLAVASGTRSSLPGAIGSAETGLRLLGLVAVADPVRASASGTIRAFREAGIMPVIITGDNPHTARAVAEQVGIGTEDGAQVYSRSTPEQKLEIVRALQASGHVVAMTGDGVNDAPALRQADIGVAMGRHGTEVARQSADLVLADDELGTLITAVQEGRRAYDNVRRFLAFGLAGGAAEVAVMVIAPFLGMGIALLPAQILWINLLTHGLPGVAMGAEPSDPDVLQRPPRPPAEPVLGAGLWQRILYSAAAITVITLALGSWAHDNSGEWQTLMFFSLGAMQFGVAVGVRARMFQRENLMLPLAIAGACVLQVMAVYVPALQDLLGTSSLPVSQLFLVLALTVIPYAVTRLGRPEARHGSH